MVSEAAGLDCWIFLVWWVVRRGGFLCWCGKWSVVAFMEVEFTGWRRLVDIANHRRGIVMPARVPDFFKRRDTHMFVQTATRICSNLLLPHNSPLVSPQRFLVVERCRIHSMFMTTNKNIY